MTFEEFEEYYRAKGYLPSPSSYRGKGRLNNKQLLTKYKEHCRKVEARANKDHKSSYYDEWIECREAVYKRDNHECRLWKVLTDEEKKIARENGYYGQFKRPTPAHLVPRSRNSKLICELANVYTLALVFHSRIDEFRSPISGEYIGKERVLNEWWKRIVPKEVFDKYSEMY